MAWRALALLSLFALLLLFAVEGNASAAPPSPGQTLFTMSASGDLIRLNPITGAGVVVGPTGFGPGEALSFSPNCQLFGTDDINSPGLHGSAQTLVTIDPATGAGAVVGPIGFADVDAMAFAPDGTLFGADAYTRQLIQIDPVTGAGTAIGATGPFIGEMAFSPSGVLFASDLSTNLGGPSTLLTIDTTTGAGTVIGPIGFSGVEGIAFTPAGTLFGISDAALGGTGDLIIIDPVTGAGAVVGPTGLPGMDGFEAYPSAVCQPPPAVGGVVETLGTSAEPDSSVDSPSGSTFNYTALAAALGAAALALAGGAWLARRRWAR
jgi:hypothetical protein